MTPQPDSIEPEQVGFASEGWVVVEEPPQKTNVTKAVLWGFGIMLVTVLLAEISNNIDSKTIKGSHSAGIPISSETEAFVCKAAIAESMGRDLSIMSASQDASKYHVTYRRPSDNSLWGQYCWLKGNRVMWQTDGGDGTGVVGMPGRVRDSEWDEVITYSINANVLTVSIEHSDNSRLSQTYNLN